MGRPQSNKNTIKNTTISELKALDLYHEEYDRVIDIYAELVCEYIKVTAEVGIGDYKVRSPVLISAENLRRDILNYSNQLGLTPAAHKKIVGESKAKPKKGLAVVLANASQSG